MSHCNLFKKHIFRVQDYSPVSCGAVQGYTGSPGFSGRVAGAPAGGISQGAGGGLHVPVPPRWPLPLPRKPGALQVLGNALNRADLLRIAG